VSDRYIVGLDIGTTKVAVVVARLTGTSTEIIATALVPSAGMKKGIVVDMEALSSSIESAVTEASALAAIEIDSVYIGIAGGHIECLKSYGAIGIKDKEVSQQDLARVIEAAGTVYVPLDREILHVLPTDYIIDGQDGIVKPLGMMGVRLEANVKVITTSQAAVDNLVKCCENAGLTVNDVVFEALASSRAVMRPEEYQSGVAVIDIGGGTTDVAVFCEGGLCHASVLPVGGNHFTNDIAIGFRVSYLEAERVKRAYGYAVGEPAGPREIELSGMDGRAFKVHRGRLGEIILPRCEEIFELIGEEIRDALLKSGAACVVLTGGASRMHGIDRVAEAKLGLPVRLGVPQQGVLNTLESNILTPEYATGVGLMLHGSEIEFDDSQDIFESFMDKLKEWKKSLFEPVSFSFGLRRIRKYELLK
jgi:cell division protein FtsA